jgi:hypothetical protein
MPNGLRRKKRPAAGPQSAYILKGRLVVKNFEMLVLWIEAIVSSQTFSHMFVISSFTFVIVSFSRKKFCFGMTLESPSRAVSKNNFGRSFS